MCDSMPLLKGSAFSTNFIKIIFIKNEIFFSITFKKSHSKCFVIVYWCNYCSMINSILFLCILDNNIITICYNIILTWSIITQFTNIFLFNTIWSVFKEAGVSSLTSFWTDLSPFCLFSTDWIPVVTKSDVIIQAFFTTLHWLFGFDGGGVYVKACARCLGVLPCFMRGCNSTSCNLHKEQVAFIGYPDSSVPARLEENWVKSILFRL